MNEIDYSIICFCRHQRGRRGRTDPRRKTTQRPPATKPAPETPRRGVPRPSLPRPQPATVTPTTVAVVNDITISAGDIEDQVSAAILQIPIRICVLITADREKETRESRQGRWMRASIPC